MKKILALGLSGFFMGFTNSLVQVICNKTLYAYGGDLYVGVMTILNAIREVVFMIVQGLNNGAQPVLGFNYGAGLYSRVRAGIRFCMMLTVGYSALVWLSVMAMPSLFVGIFSSEVDLIEAAIPAMRIYFSMFIFLSLQVSGQIVFVALGRSRLASFFALLRKMFINAPLTVILGVLIGTSGVFWAEAISQLVGGVVCIVTMYFTVYRPLGKMEDRVLLIRE